jgi:phosphonate transport system substrate-binding protein
MRRSAVIAASLGIALTLSACAAEEPAADVSDDTSTETETETEETPTGRDAWPESLVFTLTPSQEAGGLIETAEPLAALLEAELGVEIEPLVPSDYAGVIAALASGQAQIAGGLGPNQMVQAEDQADATLILQAERYGSFTYVTQWMTNDPDTFCDETPVADEDGYLFCNGVLDAEMGPVGADKLPLIAGQTVSFVDQGSTSGYLIPSLQLLESGVDPVDDIDVIFAGGHDASVQAVYDGDAIVGTSYNDARGDIVETSPDVGEKVVVWGWSGPIPNDGFAVAGDLPEDLKQAITEAFVAIAATEEGAALMNELYNIDNVKAVEDGVYEVIRQLDIQLGDILG